MKNAKILIAMLALCTAGFAQDNAAKLALAREVITASQMDKMFDSMTAQMKQMASQMAQLPANATPEQRELTEKFQAKVMDLSLGMGKEMIDNADLIYAKVYTEGELNAMKVFLLSPEGKSMIAKQPQIMALLMPIMQDMQRQMMPKIKALTDEFKAEMKAQAEAAKSTEATPVK